jgi:hypothetical protein
MRRNSTRAQQLVLLLSKAGIRVSNRRLEKLSQNGLLPLDELTSAQIAGHFAVLVEVYRGGPGAADRAAFALAYRGFGCERLRDAIVRELSPQFGTASALAAHLEATEPEWVDAESDEGLAEIEAAVDWMESGKMPEQLRWIVGMLVLMFDPKYGLARPVFDQAAYSGSGLEPAQDTPEQIAHSYFTNMIAAGIGDGIYDDTAIMAILADAEEDAAIRAVPRVLTRGGFFREADQVLVEAPIQRLVVGTLLCRAFVCYVPNLSDDQRTTAAAAMAPGIIALFDRIIEDSPSAAAELLGVFVSAYYESELVTGT